MGEKYLIKEEQQGLDPGKIYEEQLIADAIKNWITHLDDQLHDLIPCGESSEEGFMQFKPGLQSKLFLNSLYYQIADIRCNFRF